MIYFYVVIGLIGGLAIYGFIRACQDFAEYLVREDDKP